MSDIKKIKRAAVVAFLIMSAVLLYQLGRTVYFIWITTMGGGVDTPWNVTAITLLIPFLILVVSLIISLSLLYAIKKGETPFNLRNVRQLKVVAAMLILFEPCMYISQRIYFHYNPTMFVITDQFGNESISYGFGIITQGGVVLAIGLIIYCVALVFQYGISLQNQADETL